MLGLAVRVRGGGKSTAPRPCDAEVLEDLSRVRSLVGYGGLLGRLGLALLDFLCHCASPRFLGFVVELLDMLLTAERIATVAAAVLLTLEVPTRCGLLESLDVVGANDVSEWAGNCYSLTPVEATTWMC